MNSCPLNTRCAPRRPCGRRKLCLHAAVDKSALAVTEAGTAGEQAGTAEAEKPRAFMLPCDSRWRRHPHPLVNPEIKRLRFA